MICDFAFVTSEKWMSGSTPVSSKINTGSGSTDKSSRWKWGLRLYIHMSTVKSMNVGSSPKDGGCFSVTRYYFVRRLNDSIEPCSSTYLEGTELAYAP